MRFGEIVCTGYLKKTVTRKGMTCLFYVSYIEKTFLIFDSTCTNQFIVYIQITYYLQR